MDNMKKIVFGHFNHFCGFEESLYTQELVPFLPKCSHCLTHVNVGNGYLFANRNQSYICEKCLLTSNDFRLFYENKFEYNKYPIQWFEQNLEVFLKNHYFETVKLELLDFAIYSSNVNLVKVLVETTPHSVTDVDVRSLSAAILLAEFHKRLKIFD
eukprot:UN30102